MITLVQWRASKPAHDVLVIELDSPTSPITLMLSSDRHYDHPAQREQLERQQLALAEERDALILDFGDLFDAMQGPRDPRADYSLLADQYRRTDYFDSLVDNAVKRYSPYAKRWAMVAQGNHEQAVLKNYATDLTERFAAGMRASGGQTQAMPYAGWVRVFAKGVTREHNLLTLYYSHGSGKGGMMSFGTLDTRRIQSYVLADVVVQGHTHDPYVLPIARERLSTRNVVAREATWHIRCASYLDSFSRRGWDAQSGKPPRVFGCVWLVIEFNRHAHRISAHLDLVP